MCWNTAASGNSSTYTLGNLLPNLVVGRGAGDVARLSVTGGGSIQDANVSIGRAEGSTGTLTLRSNTVVNAFQLTVGPMGRRTLAVVGAGGR